MTPEQRRELEERALRLGLGGTYCYDPDAIYKKMADFVESETRSLEQQLADSRHSDKIHMEQLHDAVTARKKADADFARMREALSALSDLASKVSRLRITIDPYLQTIVTEVQAALSASTGEGKC